MMESSSWALLLTVLLCLGVVRCKPRLCSPDMNEYYNRVYGCFPCDKCPAGSGIFHDKADIEMQEGKGATTCYRCERCPTGSYSSYSSYGQCRSCKHCADDGRTTSISCSGKRNTVCGACLPNFREVYVSGKTTYPCQSCSVRGAGPGCNTTAFVTVLSFTKVKPNNMEKAEASTESTTKKETKDDTVTKFQGEHLSWMLIVVGSVLGVLVCVVLCLLIFILIRTVKQPNSRSTSIQSNLEQVHVEEPLDLGTGPIVKQTRKDNISIQNSRYQRATADDGGERIERSGESNSEDALLERRPEIAPYRERANQPSVHRSRHHHPSIDEPETMSLITTHWPTGIAGLETGHEHKLTLLRALENKLVTTNHILVMRGIGDKWRDLARKLSVTEAEIEYLESDVKESEERVHQMLLQWKRKHFQSATVGVACKALKSLGRNDLVEQLLQIEIES